MIIDSKLPGFKSFLTESRLNNGGIKTTIDQSAVAPSEQNNVAMDLQGEGHNEQEKEKKRKKEKEQELLAATIKEEKVTLSDSEAKEKNLKLLNLL